MTSRRKNLMAGLVALTLVLAACAAGSTSGSPADGTDEQVEDVAISTVSGASITLGDLEGKDVVLWFWAPW